MGSPFIEPPWSRWVGARVPWSVIGGLLATAAVLELLDRIFFEDISPTFQAGYATFYGIFIAAWFVLLLLRAPLPRSYWYGLGLMAVFVLSAQSLLFLGAPAQLAALFPDDAGERVHTIWLRVVGWFMGIGVATALTLVVYQLERFARTVHQQADALRDGHDLLETRVEERTRELAESEARFRALADAIPDIVVRFDRDHRMLYVNPAVEILTGIPREEFIGKLNVEMGFPADIVDLWTRHQNQVFETGQPSEMSFRFQVPDGEHELHSILVPEVNADGEVEHIVSVTRDITAMREAERQAELLARFAREARDIVVVTDDTGRVEWVNEGFTRVTEYTLEEVRGRKLGSVLRGPDTDPETAEALAGAVRARKEFMGQIINYTKSGKPFWMELNIQYLPPADGEPPRFVSVQRDITRRIRDQQALADSESRYRQLAEASPDAIYIVDTDGQFHFANTVVAHNFQRPVESLIGMNERDLNPPEVAQRQLANIRKASVSDKPLRFEEPLPMPVGHRWYQTILTRLPHTGDGPVQVLGIARDITEQREADRNRAAIEERVRQAQKLESMALLAGGVAHDFNNLLMAILGNASLLDEELPKQSPPHEMVKDIMVSAERAAELSRQMLAFSGHGRIASKPADLGALVEEMRTLIEASTGHQVVPEFEITPDLPAAEVDAGQVRQAVLSLVTNAVEALDENREPRVVIRTGVQHCDHAFLDAHFAGQELPEGRYVFIEVEDNGIGMTPDQRERIFEPFFTTKFTGRGLGLSAVQGIMRGHHGTAAVSSEPGKGAAVRLLFPESAGPITEEDRPGAADTWRANGTVLVADDEASVRRAVRRMLERAGLTVVTASDGLEALQVCEEYEPELSCVLLDTLMPRLDGEGALRVLRERYPGLPVVMISGYSPEYIRKNFQHHDIAGVLQKPFRAGDLFDTLRDILDEGPQEA